MIEWFGNLTPLNQALYIAAAFFSLFSIWQFIASMIGLSGADDIDIEGGCDFDVAAPEDIEAGSMVEAIETEAAFHVLSFRAILAFFTLFCWAGAMYINIGVPVARALLYGLAWGLGGWAMVTVLVNWLRRLAETGTARLATCVGGRGTVYLDIPPGGQGEIRVVVSGRVTMVRARAAGGGEIKAGTPVQVTKMLDATTVAVSPAHTGDTEPGKDEES